MVQRASDRQNAILKPVVWIVCTTLVSTLAAVPFPAFYGAQLAHVTKWFRPFGTCSNGHRILEWMGTDMRFSLLASIRPCQDFIPCAKGGRELRPRKRKRSFPTDAI